MKNFLVIFAATISLVHPKFGFSQALPQLIRPEILELVRQIERDSVLQGPRLGMMGDTLFPSPQFTRFAELQRKATLDELVLLTDHSSPVIRCHAIEAVIDSATEAFLPRMLVHLSDTAMVTVQAFDFIRYMTVGDYLRVEVLPSCLLHILPNEKSYELIRNLVVREEVPAAIVALARFGRQTDEGLIIARVEDEATRYYGLMAMREFPAASFFPVLRRIHSEYLSELSLQFLAQVRLYEVLVQYKTAETVTLLEQALLAAQREEFRLHRIYIFAALEKYPAPVFRNVKDGIKLEMGERRLLNTLMSHGN
ncbi:MAG: hypothetical protein ACREOI_24605 [bacterium]